MTKPWINHDIHRSAPRPVKIRTPRKLKPYPTMQRLHELFRLEDGKLIWIKPARKEPSQGWINPKCGTHYIRVDDRNCQVNRLIRIYMGEE